MCVNFDGAPDPVLDFALCTRVILEQCNQEMAAQFALDKLAIRMGISTGSCFGGVIGTQCPRFHLFGEAEDVAIRIEQNGIPGEIIVSKPVWDLSNRRYRYTPLPDVIKDFECFVLHSKLPEKQY
jgi:class 3 adenylate cyclase